MLTTICLKVNGEKHKVDVKAHWSLAYVIREKIGLTGTKTACEMGTCGSCTVIMDGQAIFSCLKLAVDAEGTDIITIEGLEEEGKLHPLQSSFMEHHGMQCGYCTPGMIMSAKALLDKNPRPTELGVREAIGGHLCRCGTYPRIVKSIMAAADTMKK
jgi:aerobic carbon-monoxide dehydrogenase small subunit